MTSNNQNGKCEVFYPQTVPCSGNGVCSDSICKCSNGFSSVGDFALIEGLDCDIHITTIKVLYSIFIAVSVIPFILSVRFLIYKLMLYRDKTHPVLLIPINFIPMFIIFSILSFQVVAWLRVMEPEKHYVGKSAASTVFFGIAFVSGWMSQLLYLYVFTDLAIRQSRMKSTELWDKSMKMVQLLKKFIITLSLLSFIWGFIPLSLLSNPYIVNIIGPIHYIGATMNFVVSSFIAIPNTLIPVRNDIAEALERLGIKSASKNGKYISMKQGDLATPTSVGLDKNVTSAMQDAERKLTFAIGFLWRATFQELGLALIFGLWPFFLRKASYQLPFTYIVTQLAFSIELYSISNFTAKKSATSSALSSTREKDAISMSDNNNTKFGKSQTQVASAQI